MFFLRLIRLMVLWWYHGESMAIKSVAAGNRINEILIEKNMKVIDLSRKSGVSPSTIYAITNYRRIADLNDELIRKICNGFNITEYEFYNWYNRTVKTKLQ